MNEFAGMVQRKKTIACIGEERVHWQLMYIPTTGQETPLKCFFVEFRPGRLQKALPVSDDGWFAYILRFI
jgi:hypothetical protein